MLIISFFAFFLTQLPLYFMYCDIYARIKILPCFFAYKYIAMFAAGDYLHGHILCTFFALDNNIDPINTIIEFGKFRGFLASVFFDRLGYIDMLAGYLKNQSYSP